MKVLIVALLVAAVTAATHAIAAESRLAPVNPVSVGDAEFPPVAGDNLSGKTYRLPRDLEGDLNLLLIASKRQQQKDVNTWFPYGEELEKRFEGFRYYEIPTIGSGYTFMRSFIDNGMRGGIPSVDQRNRTITLYLDKGPYKKSLNIRSENTIYAALVNRAGKVLYLADGRFSEEKARPLTSLLEKALAEKAGAAPTGDIVETALAAGQFKVLTRALASAGLVKALQGDGPFTVFAPTDAAFAKLPKGTVAALLRPENREKLVGILTYHVVPGRLAATQVVQRRGAETLAEKPVAFRVEKGAVRINEAEVVKADVAATNGVIHVIDQVLLPPSRTVAPVASGVRGLIELAYERGVPLFNDGKPEACVAIYEVAATGLLALASDLAESERAELKKALEAIRTETDPRRKAWILRYALDAAYRSAATTAGSGS
jgi:uncharacterized surface protein with fasciclin (FAS1) repeats